MMYVILWSKCNTFTSRPWDFVLLSFISWMVLCWNYVPVRACEFKGIKRRAGSAYEPTHSCSPSCSNVVFKWLRLRLQGRSAAGHIYSQTQGTQSRSNSKRKQVSVFKIECTFCNYYVFWHFLLMLCYILSVCLCHQNYLQVAFCQKCLVRRF